MMKFSKTTLLTIFLIIFIILTGFFAFQWWQVRGDLRKKIEENESLMKQVNELQAEIDKFKKEIEELEILKKEVDEKEIRKTNNLRTYKNKEWNFEIKYPSEWNVEDKLPPGGFSGQVGFSGKNIGFSIIINGFVDRPIPREEISGEEIIVLGNKVYPRIYTISKPDGCIVYLDMCFSIKNKEYLGNYCPETPRIGDYYQFSIFCGGKEWKEIKRIEKCQQLFEQIITTFKFAK